MDEPARLSDRRPPRPGAAPAGQGPDATGDGHGAPPPGGRRPAGLSAAPELPGGSELPELLLWHVCVTFAGPALDVEALDAALRRLVDAQPFLASVRYAPDRAEVSYWDEAEDVDDAAALGLRMWAEHRRVAELPDWRAVGIEVVDRETFHARGQRLPPPARLGEVRPW